MTAGSSAGGSAVLLSTKSKINETAVDAAKARLEILSFKSVSHFQKWSRNPPIAIPRRAKGTAKKLPKKPRWNMKRREIRSSKKKDRKPMIKTAKKILGFT